MKPIFEIDAIPLERLFGLDAQKEAICKNTEAFLHGRASNNVLLWGARGSGKSSLIKSLILKYASEGLRIIEIDKDELDILADIGDELRDLCYKFIIFLDDLSFEEGDKGYKVLKRVMEGSLEAPPKNMKIYATSNRRHLVPEYMKDNQNVSINEKGEIHYGDAIEEAISLSDRFGISLAFYQGNIEEYLQIVEGYFEGSDIDREALRKEALKFAAFRGTRSGRVAKQFHDRYLSALSL